MLSIDQMDETDLQHQASQEDHHILHINMKDVLFGEMQSLLTLSPTYMFIDLLYRIPRSALDLRNF